MRVNLRPVLFIAAVSAALAAGLFATPTHADPLPGRDLLKFQQLPMDNLTYPVAIPGGPTGDRTFWGHDEFSTAYSNPFAGFRLNKDPHNETAHPGQGVVGVIGVSGW